MSTTQASAKYYKKHKSIVRAALKSAGFSNIKISNGYFYFSGFATKADQVIYFSISDVRHFDDGRLMIRTARDYKDYTGGMNNFCALDKDSIARLANRLVSRPAERKAA